MDQYPYYMYLFLAVFRSTNRGRWKLALPAYSMQHALNRIEEHFDAKETYELVSLTYTGTEILMLPHSKEPTGSNNP